MLAKEIKIKSIKRQREFIKKKLDEITTSREDGNTTYIYIGDVFPEVIKYFENEGFVVTPINNDMMLALHSGLPTYRFTIGDIELSEEELKQAEEYELKDEDGKNENMELFRQIFGDLLYDDLY